MTKLSDLTAARASSDSARDFLKLTVCKMLASRSVGIDPYELFLASRAGAKYQKAAVGAVTDSDIDVTLARAFQPILDKNTLPGQLPLLDVEPQVSIDRATIDPGASFIAEGAGVPLVKYSAAYVRMLAHKVASLIVFTREIERLNEDQQIAFVQLRIKRNFREVVDEAFLSTSAANATTPGGILAGVSAVTYGSGGGLPENVEDLYSAVSNGDAEQPFFVTSGRGALYLAGVDGGAAFPHVRVDGTGHIAGVRVLASPAAGNKLILLDASKIARWSGSLETTTSREAAIEMVDNPSHNSGTGTGSNVVSLFQTNALGVLVVRRTSWIVTDNDHASYVELPIGGSPS